VAPAIISLKVFKKNNVELAVVVGGDTNNGFAGYSAAGLVRRSERSRTVLTTSRDCGGRWYGVLTTSLNR